MKIYLHKKMQSFRMGIIYLVRTSIQHERVISGGKKCQFFEKFCRRTFLVRDYFFMGIKSTNHAFESTVVLYFELLYQFSLNLRICIHKIALKEKAQMLGLLFIAGESFIKFQFSEVPDGRSMGENSMYLSKVFYKIRCP